MEEYNAGVPIDLGKLDGTWRLQYTSAPDVLVLLESAARFSFFQVLQLNYKIMFFLFWTFYSLLFTFFFPFCFNHPRWWKLTYSPYSLCVNYERILLEVALHEDACVWFCVCVCVFLFVLVLVLVSFLMNLSLYTK